MSAFKNGVAVRTLCVTDHTIMDAAHNLQCGRSRILPEMKLARNSVRSQTTQPDNEHSSHTDCSSKQVGKGEENALESVSLSPVVFFPCTERLPNEERCSRRVLRVQIKIIAQVQAWQLKDFKRKLSHINFTCLCCSRSEDVSTFGLSHPPDSHPHKLRNRDHKR